MGGGNTDTATHTGCLDLPLSFSVVTRVLQEVEKVMGPI